MLVSFSVYCDESKAKGFVLVAASVPCGDHSRARDALERLTLKRQVRIHFRREDDARKEKILEALLELGCIAATVYDARGRSDKEGRDVAVARMAEDAARGLAQRIVVETDDSVVAADKLIIASRLLAAGRDRQTSFHHMRASEESLLALPDTLAWCYAKDGAWRRRVEPMIKEVIVL
jgi:hypothetical protein